MPALAPPLPVDTLGLPLHAQFTLFTALATHKGLSSVPLVVGGVSYQLPACGYMYKVHSVHT